MNTHRPRTALVSTALALLLPLSAHALTFSIVDLGPAAGWDPRTLTLGHGLNSRGDVVGQIGTSASTQTGRWLAPAADGTKRVGVYVPPAAGYSNALAYDVNSQGTAVGTLGAGGNLAAAMVNGAWRTLPAIGSSAASSGFGYGIADNGQIVGQDLPGNYGFPVRWRPDGQGGWTAERLSGLGGGGIAHDVNELGQVAGGSNVGALLGATHAVLWEADNRVTDLGVLNPTFDFSLAHALNGDAVVVGDSRNARNQLEAFRWEGGSMVGLGAIPGWQAYPHPISTPSSARDINDAGWIVGQALRGDGQMAGFLWRDGQGMVDLNNLVSPGDPFFSSPDVYTPAPGFLITGAAAVNDRGQVLAYGRYNLRTGPASAWQVTHAFLLTPDVAPAIPEPATWATLLLGMLAIGAYARRRGGSGG
jgi:probable HAF family extracellular repeat protein